MGLIQHFTDNDLYKFTTQHAALRCYPEAEVRYAFFNRNGRPFPANFHKLLQAEVEAMANLALQPNEAAFLRKNCPFLAPDYIAHLQNFRYRPSDVAISQQNHQLKIEIEGPWHQTILWEVPLMALISELYFKTTPLHAAQVAAVAHQKGSDLKALQAEFSDFGTRRRFSFEVQKKVVEALKQSAGPFLKGTSNVYMALQNQLTPMGTHPHEWFMFHGALEGYAQANTKSLEAWIRVFGRNLGIALTDTFTTPNFLSHFTPAMAHHFDGVRWDSGNPLKFTDRIVHFYQQMGINPKTKTIVYSDALNLQKIAQIKQHVQHRTHDVYGIGTFLTNDVGVNPLNMVVKMTHARASALHPWQPTVKLSDVAEKHTGDASEIARSKQLLGIYTP